MRKQLVLLHTLRTGRSVAEAEVMSIGIMLRQREQRRNKLDGTDCVKSRCSPSQPSSYTPSRAQAPSPSVVRALGTSARGSNTKNRPIDQKTGTAAPRDRSHHKGQGKTDQPTDKRTCGAPPLKFAARPKRREIKARGTARPGQRGTSQEAARPPPKAAPQPGSGRPVRKSRAAS